MKKNDKVWLRATGNMCRRLPPEKWTTEATVVLAGYKFLTIAVPGWDGVPINLQPIH